MQTFDGTPLQARRATDADWPTLRMIIRHVTQHDDSHCLSPDHSDEGLHAIWFAPVNTVYTVWMGGQIVGTFFLRRNFDGRGVHVGNASYMVHPDHRRIGVGAAMGAFSLEEARRLGFTAMQFNSVVSTNERALRLWHSLGFTIIGTVPQAYRHQKHGLVDTHILFRFL